jgi:hypothetical protein
MASSKSVTRIIYLYGTLKDHCTSINGAQLSNVSYVLVGSRSTPFKNSGGTSNDKDESFQIGPPFKNSGGTSNDNGDNFQIGPPIPASLDQYF